jgi:DNA-binding MarR family transcriptional regulator
MTQGLATRHDGPESSPGFLLWQVTNRWQAALRAALRPFDLTHVQFVLLASLSWLAADQPVTQRQLATHAAADVMMTSQVLRTLESNGYVSRTASSADKRAILVDVTPEGRDLANRANEAVEQCDARFFAALGKEEHSLTELLGRLAPPSH